MHSRLLGLRTSILGLLLVLLAACETTPSAPPPGSMEKMHTLGIISSLGVALHYDRVGAGGWDNDFFTTPIAPLGIDPYVVDLATKQLAGRFDVRPVQYNPGDFVGSVTSDTAEAVAARIRSSAKPADLDAYLLILPGNSTLKSSGNVFDASGQEVSGLGLTRKSWVTNHDYWAHALYVVVVVDGHTGKVLSETGAPGGYQKTGFLEFPAMGGPYLDVDAADWPQDPQHPTPQLVGKLVDETLKPLLAQSMGKTLQTAKLIP
jgi:hypothetical protein